MWVLQPFALSLPRHQTTTKGAGCGLAVESLRLNHLGANVQPGDFSRLRAGGNSHVPSAHSGCRAWVEKEGTWGESQYQTVDHPQKLPDHPMIENPNLNKMARIMLPSRKRRKRMAMA